MFSCSVYLHSTANQSSSASTPFLRMRHTTHQRSVGPTPFHHADRRGHHATRHITQRRLLLLPNDPHPFCLCCAARKSLARLNTHSPDFHAHVFHPDCVSHKNLILNIGSLCPMLSSSPIIFIWALLTRLTTRGMSWFKNKMALPRHAEPTPTA
jgi:hypothetical protein